jgi:predicted amidohydrolase
MKICAAQTRPIRGDISANITIHEMLIHKAVARGAELIIFPELSLTGYEPTLAKELTVEKTDVRFDTFQTISNDSGITIGVGAPMKSERGVSISMLLFQPHEARSVYSKSYLHADEEPFFVPGHSSPHLRVQSTNVALAICYEISVAEHLTAALKLKPAIYFASVAKFVNGINKALERLSTIARDSSLPVLMSNCIGFSDGQQCGGHTSAWNSRGSIVGQLNDSDEGLLVFDTETQQLVRE